MALEGMAQHPVGVRPAGHPHCPGSPNTLLSPPGGSSSSWAPAGSTPSPAPPGTLEAGAGPALGAPPAPSVGLRPAGTGPSAPSRGAVLGGTLRVASLYPRWASCLGRAGSVGPSPNLPSSPCPTSGRGLGGILPPPSSPHLGGRGPSSRPAPPAPRSPLHPPGSRPPKSPPAPPSRPFLPPAGSRSPPSPTSSFSPPAPGLSSAPSPSYPPRPLLRPRSRCPPSPPSPAPLPARRPRPAPPPSPARPAPLPRALTACPSSWRATFILAIPGRLPPSSAPRPGRAGPPPPPQRRLPPPPPWPAPGAAPPPGPGQGPGPGPGRDGAAPEGWSRGGWYRRGATRGHRVGAGPPEGWLERGHRCPARSHRTAPLRSTRSGPAAKVTAVPAGGAPHRHPHGTCTAPVPAPGAAPVLCTLASEGGTPAPALVRRAVLGLAQHAPVH